MRCLLVLLVGCAVLVGAPAAEAVPVTYLETFTDTAYRDDAGTTAEWNTGLGELRLQEMPISELTTHGFVPERMAIRGRYLYSVEGTSFTIWDISDPVAPSLVGSETLPSANCRDVVADGPTVRVLTLTQDIAVSVTDPTAPMVVGTFAQGGLDLHIHGTVDIYAAGSGGVVFRKDNLVSVTAFPLAAPARAVAVNGRYAYAGTQSGEIRILDFLDPLNPVSVGSVAISGRVNTLLVDGTRLYAGGSLGLEIFDIGPDPTLPSHAGSLACSEVFRLRLWGRLLYAVGGGEFKVVDVTRADQPSLAGTWPASGGADVATPGDEHVILADVNTGAVTLSLGQFLSVPWTESRTNLNQRRSVVAGGRLFTFDETFFRIYSLDDPTAPQQLSFTTEQVGQFRVEGSTLYSVYPSGVKIIDVGEPTAPAVLFSDGFYGGGSGLTLAGNRLHVVHSSTLRMWDVSDPAAPVAGIAASLSSGEAVDGDGPLVYAVSDGFGVNDFSLFQMNEAGTSYSALGTWDSGSPFQVNGLLARGSEVLITGGSLYVLDVSNLFAPGLTGVYATPSVSLSSPTAAGSHLLVREGAQDFRHLDIADPASVGSAGFLDYGGFGTTYSNRVWGEYLFLSDSEDGFGTRRLAEILFANTSNEARSLELDGLDDPIKRVRVLADADTKVLVELTLDGGATWLTDVPLDGDWYTPAAPGSDLRWRSRHHVVNAAVNPALRSLLVEWLYDFPAITAVDDIGNDQGRQVRVSWRRSALDELGSGQPIVEYAVYRAHDGNKAAPAAGADKLAGWDLVATVPAETDDAYSVVVPTLADSTIAAGDHFTSFLVRARTATPGLFFQSYPDSGYSVDNLAPAVPAGLVAAYATGSGNQLTWEEPVDADFQHFRIYRGNAPGFVPGPATYAGAAVTPAWTDPVHDGPGVFYLVTAVDFSGNESGPAAPGAVTAVDTPAAAPVLHGNVPNPFNPVTTIAFELAAAAPQVLLQVYDLKGTLVATLHRGPAAAGRHELAWGGLDDAGREAPSGTYLSRLTVGGRRVTGKMTLVR